MSHPNSHIRFYVCACVLEVGLIVQQCIQFANVPVLIIST